MKKLLLVLICLVVSFEVKSESDDSSGKKLVCVDEKDTIYVGLEFISKNKFIEHFIHSPWEPQFYLKTEGVYYTTLTHIFTKFKKDMFIDGKKITEIKYKINREDLILEDFTIEPSFLMGRCKVVKINIEDFFLKAPELKKQQIKKKRKI
tara:strand:+ start:333 stop:782 length:450 start_codon:yes stop_codon:yes gene_type:complete